GEVDREIPHALPDQTRDGGSAFSVQLTAEAEHHAPVFDGWKHLQHGTLPGGTAGITRTPARRNPGNPLFNRTVSTASRAIPCRIRRGETSPRPWCRRRPPCTAPDSNGRAWDGRFARKRTRRAGRAPDHRAG